VLAPQPVDRVVEVPALAVPRIRRGIGRRVGQTGPDAGEGESSNWLNSTSSANHTGAFEMPYRSSFTVLAPMVDRSVTDPRLTAL
jgi:hypothetical protein